MHPNECLALDPDALHCPLGKACRIRLIFEKKFIVRCALDDPNDNCPNTLTSEGGNVCNAIRVAPTPGAQAKLLIVPNPVWACLTASLGGRKIFTYLWTWWCCLLIVATYNVADFSNTPAILLIFPFLTRVIAAVVALFLTWLMAYGLLDKNRREKLLRREPKPTEGELRPLFTFFVRILPFLSVVVIWMKWFS